MTKIRNLIFDLGGLFIDVYMHRFEERLAQFLGRSPQVELLQLQQNGWFDAYETGKMGTAEFLSGLEAAFEQACSAAQLAEAWNAILGQLQLKQLSYVADLRKTYRVVLLSNTNDLHVEALEQEFETRYPQLALTDFFDEVYYSQRIGLRKPDRAAFDFVLRQQSFDPHETLFVDDTPGHLLGAQAAGLSILLHPRNADLAPTMASIRNS